MPTYDDSIEQEPLKKGKSLILVPQSRIKERFIVINYDWFIPVQSLRRLYSTDELENDCTIFAYVKFINEFEIEPKTKTLEFSRSFIVDWKLKKFRHIIEQVNQSRPSIGNNHRLVSDRFQFTHKIIESLKIKKWKLFINYPRTSSSNKQIPFYLTLKSPNAPQPNYEKFEIISTRALTVHQTWAHRCDKHVFLTATNLTKWNNISLPILNLFDVGDNYLELSIKVFDALNIIIQQPYDFDWLFIADDDTYVIMENLRQLLYQTSKPLAFGHLFRPTNGAPNHFSGGAGYAINTVALQRMLPNLQTTCSEWYVPGMEDVYVSRCLQHLNVTLDGAFDGIHHRFYPLDFMTMYKMELPKWFSDYNLLKSYSGFNCCSSKSISFHYMTRELMNFVEWARYLHDN